MGKLLGSWSAILRRIEMGGAEKPMRSARPLAALALGLALGLALFLLATPTLAQTSGSRILRGLEFQPIPGDAVAAEVIIRTGVPIRYVRHTPVGRTDRLEIQFTSLTGSKEALLKRSGPETLKAPDGLAIPLREVHFGGERTGGDFLELRFDAPVLAIARQGSDLRSLIVRVEVPRKAATGAVARRDADTTQTDPDAAMPPEESADPPATLPSPRSSRASTMEEEATFPAPRADEVAVELGHKFALQLYAGPSDAPLPNLPDTIGKGQRLYTAPFQKDGEEWLRLRLGFFESAKAANAARDQIPGVSPDAWALEVDLEERLASASNALSKAHASTKPAPSSPNAPARAVVPGESLVTKQPSPRPPQKALTTEEASELDRLMDEGRKALAGGQLDRAVQLFTKVLTLPESDRSPEALEWLGLARERKGQEAHARAEYEAYLERYPEGDASVRVRQRLDALLTARDEPTEPLREARRHDRVQQEFDVFGSIGTYYRRDERFTEDAGDLVVDSSLATDFFTALRGERGGWDIRSEVSGTHLHDFLDDNGDWRFDTLFFEALGRTSPWGFGVGRLPGNRSGLTSRFDGGRVSYGLTEKSRISAVAGLPVEPFVTSSIQYDQQLVGLSFEALEWWEGVDVELFGIQQWADGITDRTAIGTEFSYADESRFFAGQVDYDIHFMELNTAFLVGSWQASEDTNFNLFLDWRKLPFLSTRNALFGQFDDDLDDLRERFGTGELQDLAEDRTARSRSATLGVTHQLSERFQVAADVGLSDLSGTPASGGIEGFEGTGRQISTFLQLIGTQLIQVGDVGTVGVRYIDARDVDIAGLVWSWRSPVWRRFRFNPLFDLLWRRPDVGDSVFTYRPGLRIDYRVGPFTVDLDGRYEWSNGERFPGVEDEEAYTLLFGVRYDY